MSSLLNGIEDFTTNRLRREIRRREDANRKGLCWYCGQDLQTHTCKYSLVNQELTRPVIVCLCGSTRFPDAFIAANRQETLAGKIVLSVGLFGHGENMDMAGPIKKQLDELHLRKIDLSDEILVLNVNGYLGDSTRREIAYAIAHNKTVCYLEEFGQSIAVIKPL